MTDNYLFGVDEIQRLIGEYVLAPNSDVREHIERRIIEETVGEIYPDRAPTKTGFPSGTALLVALIQLHRETDDADVAELIEREIETVRDGLVPVADFDTPPHPYAPQSELMAYVDHFTGCDEAVSRYFRLRVFKQLGVFDDKGMLHVRGTNGKPVEGLTDEEQEYLEAM